jgi:hypothetical protein
MQSVAALTVQMGSDIKFQKILILSAFIAFSHLSSANALDLPLQVQNYLQTQHLLDEGEKPLPDSRAANANVFVEYTLTHWQAMLDNISTIAPTSRQQYIIIRAIESLPGKVYLDALNKLCDLEEKKIISTAALEFAIDGRIPKNGFLANNYQDPRVVRLVCRAQRLLPRDAKIQGVLADILSGKRIEFERKKIEDEDLGQPEKLPPQ